ncbi:hypothetical protein [Pasteurella testudinis]|uniref:hypothetical protein n=1 Tax=Pasteurella testudinis TaxID=761 RepID=UPI00405833A0
MPVQTVKTTLDFPIDLKKSVKTRLAVTGQTMREYIIALIEKDLANAAQQDWFNELPDYAKAHFVKTDAEIRNNTFQIEPEADPEKMAALGNDLWQGKIQSADELRKRLAEC